MAPAAAPATAPAAASLLLWLQLLSTCYYYCCAVVLLLLLCLRYLFAADPREHGGFAIHPLSVMRARVFKLKD